MASIPWRQLSDACKHKAESVSRTLLPDGKRSGDWWKVRSPFRGDDKNPSFAVSLTTGWWRDYGTGDYGDLISMLAKLRGISRDEAAIEMAGIVGISLDTPEKQAKRERDREHRLQHRIEIRKRIEAIGR